MAMILASDRPAGSIRIRLADPIGNGKSCEDGHAGQQDHADPERQGGVDKLIQKETK